MAVEQWHIDHIFIDLRGRVFRGLNRWFVSRRGASLDPGTDVISLSAGSVEFWLATGARGTDYETLLLGWVQRDCITRCRPGGLCED